jgi:hypothetical protein
MQMGHQCAAWDAVLRGPAIAAALPHGSVAPELARRDAALSYRPVRATLALDDWPQASRPDLDRARRLSLPRNPDSVLYFNLDSSTQHRHHSGDSTYDRYRPGNHW